MMRIYGIKTCDTCRKALKSLEAAGHDVTFVDMRATPLERSTLSDFLKVLGDGLLNTRSTTWRGLSEAERARPELDLLWDHPTLMKRPVIEQGGLLTMGWSKDVQARYLP